MIVNRDLEDPQPESCGAEEEVEVSPAFDHAQLTALAAANVVYELMCLMVLGSGR